MDPEKFRRALGDELRRLRTAKSWTRPDLVDEASNPISVRALQSYEAGERELTAFNLMKLCRALHCDLATLFARVSAQLGVAAPGHLRLDLRAVLQDDTSDLLPLRRWARVQLDALADDDPAVVDLSPDAIRPMSTLCGLKRGQFERRIKAMTSRQRAKGGA